MKSDEQPFYKALNLLYGSVGFNPYSRQAMCGDLENWAVKFKEVVTASKGKLKTCCTTAQGISDFLEENFDDLDDLNSREYRGEGKYEKKWPCREKDGICQEGKLAG
ncbi:hypothetical protein [Nocardia sp. NPDC050175]|uniref:hypothetical protein n=1 Tax=Nocardia sp. NPDC050175 TaxID=3364317 RepID=UPI0037B7B88D